MAYLFIYLIQISDIIVTICIISSFLSFFAGFFYIMTVCEDSLFNNNTIKLAKTAFFITITVAIITGFFPSRQTILLSGVTYYGSKGMGFILNKIIHNLMNKCFFQCSL